MHKFLIRLIIEHFYTANELFNRIRSNKIKKVQKFIMYLKKHDPDTLKRILQTSACTDYFLTPLSSSLVHARYYPDGFPIVAALLESSPEVYATLFEWNPTILFSALDSNDLPELRLLFWHVRDSSLSVKNPKTGLTAEQLILEREQRYLAFQARAWEVEPCVDQQYAIKYPIMLSWYLTRERFKLAQKAETEFTANHYELALEAYNRLKDICVEYAQLEARISYSYDRDARPYLYKFYQDCGHRYEQAAFKVCEQWLQKFNVDLATLNREQLAEYRNALMHAVRLARQLGNSDSEQRYSAMLSSLLNIELSPAATATHIAPAQIIVSDPSTHRAPYTNQASIQHISSLEEDPCYAP